MSDDFYRAFEDRHRGSRDSILSRLAAYRPFIAPLVRIYEHPPALDLGCGRGEWLEFLIGEGFAPTGVDVDEGMLAACWDRGLPASNGDASAVLGGSKDESLAVVSAFHVVEHITFDQLRALVAESLRVLKPGGLLIMETPNPENILVATQNFYLDPTHLRPIPSQLLSFLSEYYGFARTKVIRLQQQRELESRERLSLEDVLAGVSPDYAVVAQKGADANIMESLDSAFARNYGLSLSTLATRYDMGVLVSVERAEEAARQSAAQVQELAAQARKLAVQAQDAMSRAQHTSEILEQVYASRSWKLTSPLRWVVCQIGLVKTQGLKERVRALLWKVVRTLYASLDTRPILKTRMAAISRRCGVFPYLKAFRDRVVQTYMSSGFTTQSGGSGDLTPRSQMIYRALKAARERRRGDL